jgi:hypothetical protein
MLPSPAGPQLNERIDEELARYGGALPDEQEGLVWSPTIPHSSFSHRPFFTASAIAPFADNIN